MGENQGLDAAEGRALHGAEGRRVTLQGDFGGSSIGRRYEVVAMTAGQANGLEYSALVVEVALPLFEGVTVFVDHAQLAEMWSMTGNRSLRGVLGVLEGCYYAPASEGINGTLRVYPGADEGWFTAMVDQYLADKAAGRETPRVGLSAVVDVKVQNREVVSISRVVSVDAVFDPARGGEFIRALNQQQEEGSMLKLEKPPLVDQIVWDGLNDVEKAEMMQKGAPVGGGGRLVNEDPPKPLGGGGVVASGVVAGPKAPAKAVHAGNLAVPPVAVIEPGTVQTQAAGSAPSAGAAVQGGFLRNAQIDPAVLSALSENLLSMRLEKSNLPEAMQTMLRTKYGGGMFSVDGLDAEVEALQAAWAASVAATGTQVRGVGQPRWQVTLGEADRLQAVMDQLVGLKPKSELLQGVAPISGIRELYLMLTGDYNFVGSFDKERVALANVTTATMTSLVKNAFNKVILDYFNSVFRWWEFVASEESFTSMKQITLITLGGFVDLPTVAEGAAYAELSWSDAEETADFVKKGGYVGVTLEMMDKDETRSFRAIPRKLAIAGYRTLGSLVSALFTDNSGVGPYWPSSQAVLYLFSATYGNLGSAALTASSWDACIQSMYKMAEATSSKRMGIRPAYLLVPIELEKTALTIMQSEGEPGTGDNDANVRAGSSRVVAVPLWTNATRWGAVADPRVWPGIVIGYRFGRAPEVFISGEETIGSMFTNDEMRIKARFIVAVGVGDYRPLYKSNP